MELKGFYSEETLRPLLYKGEISTLEFLFHYSEEQKQEFENYCKENDLPLDEDSAKKFMDYQLKVEERDHIEDSL